MTDKKELEKSKGEIGIATDEDIANAKALAGTIMLVPRWNESATKDSIRHFADGIGDPNPLWRDEHYANNSRYGSIIAPPTFLNSICQITFFEGLPGLSNYMGDSEWEWLRIVRVKDTLTVTNVFEDLVMKRSEPIGRRMFLQAGTLTFRNQRDEVVARCRWSSLRPEIVKESGKLVSDKLEGQKRYAYTKEELDAIEQAYADEEIRGGKPRYWEDVVIGDEIKPVVKGPLGLTDMVSFVMGAGQIQHQAHGLNPARRDPSLGWRDPETGALELVIEVHFLDRVARGLSYGPFAFDFGKQRVCWLGHLMTNWMGDDGFLKKLKVPIRGLNYHGDTNWCRGKVVDKFVEDNEHVVKCEVWFENQRHETSHSGHAIVVLPSRGINNLP